jgi:hypothetical protein
MLAAARRLAPFAALLLAALPAAAQQQTTADINAIRGHLTDPRRITLSSSSATADPSVRGGDARFRDRLGGTVALDGNLRPRDFGRTYRTESLIPEPPARDGSIATGKLGPTLPRSGLIPTNQLVGTEARAKPHVGTHTGVLDLAHRGPDSLFRVVPPPAHGGPAPPAAYLADAAKRDPPPLVQIGYLPTRLKLDLYRHGPDLAHYGEAYARVDAPILPPRPLATLPPAVAPPAAAPARTDVPRAGPDQPAAPPPPAALAGPDVPRGGPDRPVAPPPPAAPLTPPPPAAPASLSAP